MAQIGAANRITNRISLSASQFDHFGGVNKMVFWRLPCV